MIYYTASALQQIIPAFFIRPAQSGCARSSQKGCYLVSKWLYPAVAKLYGTNWKAVERNIRTVSYVIWRNNRHLLEQLARRPLLEKPRNAQLLAILVSALDTGPLSVHGLSETVALAGKDNVMGVMDEPVNEGCGEPVVSKYCVPLGKLQV